MSKNPKSRFVIAPQKAESMRHEKGLRSLRDLLPLLLPAAAALARPTISHFPVAAAALGISGQIYLGANIEFPTVPLHHSIHAEQFAITNAILQSEPSIPFLAISHSPCGHCLQFLQELRSSSQIHILVSATAATGAVFEPISCFLPRPFGPSDLLREEIPLLLDSRFNGLREMCGGGEGGAVRAAAVRAANESHAPYSGSPAGFAVGDEEGRVYAGSYAESAAYNPSLGPVQAAFVAFLVGGDGGGIVEGVLAEREGAPVSQEKTARILFQVLAPAARFSVCRLGSSAGGEVEPETV